MRGFGKSDVGKVRVGNEDAIYLNNEGPAPLANLFALADGMGGHNAGDVASKQAISSFCEYFNNHKHFVYTEEFLANALLYANTCVHESARNNPEYFGMGTTFSAVTADENNLYYVHVGDSRIYTITEGKMTQLTRDHSLVAEMAEKGLITPEEARNHPEKNVITRVIGTDAHVEVDKGYISLKNLEYILICSDGLTDMLTDNEIFEIIATEGEIPDKIDELIAKANAGGGDDNISVVVVGWNE